MSQDGPDRDSERVNYLTQVVRLRGLAAAAKTPDASVHFLRLAAIYEALVARFEGEKAQPPSDD
jgi:hypothetical protein